MLEQTDSLHTIAELAIALAGFAGIVVALDRRLSAEQVSVHGGFGVLLGSSFGAALFAFVPEWVEAAGLAPGYTWHVSNGLFGAYRLTYVGIATRAARRAGSPIPRPVSVGALALGVCHLAAAAGLIELQYFVYLTGLLWSLAMAVLSFARLVREIRPENGAA